jgi:outer membrane protein TolC
MAEQLQVDLTAARVEDLIQSKVEDERSTIAAHHVAMGSQQPSVPSTDMAPPDALLPVESFEQLEESTRTHPLIEFYGHLANSKEELARAKNAERYPSFTVGVDWILTGQARMPDVEDSGKDALMLGAGMSLPLWQGSYANGADAARAEARAERFSQTAAVDQAVFELKASLAAVRDTTRRARFYQQTLLPQADAAYASVLGSYATGEGTVAQALLAQRDLLEIRGELTRARAEYALAWADLERIVGRSLAGRDVTAQDDLGGIHGTR